MSDLVLIYKVGRTTDKLIGVAKWEVVTSTAFMRIWRNQPKTNTITIITPVRSIDYDYASHKLTIKTKEGLRAECLASKGLHNIISKRGFKD